MIQPKNITVKTESGEDKVYTLTKIPYMSGGREILTQFIPTAMPKVGDYQLNEALSKKLFGFVFVDVGGNKIALSTTDLINNHVPDFQVGLRIEKEMLEYNFGFFDQGKILAFFQDLGQKAQASILPILTRLLEQSSQKAEPPSKN